MTTASLEAKEKDERRKTMLGRQDTDFLVTFTVPQLSFHSIISNDAFGLPLKDNMM